jgi:putative two-component system response regulator
MKALSDCKVLIVDDSPSNIDVLVETLKDHYHLSVAVDGPDALANVTRNKPDIILLDVMMPKMSGFEVCRILRNSTETKEIPIFFLTALDESESKVRAFDYGAVDYITKPFYPSEVLSRLRTHLSLLLARRELSEQNNILEIKVRERTLELENNQKETIIRLALAAEHRDTDTGSHIRRIQEYSKLLARHSGLDEAQSEDLGLASTMHDLGKIGIPDNILLKPGRLTPEEMVIMRSHTEIGANILANSDSRLIAQSRDIALTHHEHFDGKGYPRGLSGKDIPLGGRIVCLADVFDALGSKRPYKEPWPFDKAVEAILQGRGTHFDPDLTDVFEAHRDEIYSIYIKWSCETSPRPEELMGELITRG